MNARALFLLPLAALTGCAASSQTGPQFRSASEHNLAFMLAEPLDLVGPAPATPRMSARRDAVFQHYTRGEDTAARRTGAENASVSDVGKAGN